MAHSTSSLNSFTSCMKRYELVYVQKIRPEVEDSEHLRFGSMAHEVLEKAGLLRDAVSDGIDVDYETVIPSELLYHDLKMYFGIQNWHNYFSQVINQVYKYEQEEVKNLLEYTTDLQIFREHKMQLTPQELKDEFGVVTDEPLVGVIDLLILGKNYATILDYKFSTTRKNQNDFDMNSQLPIYALFVNKTYGIPLNNIRVGYIDIPKQDFDEPTVLKNGTLSRALKANVSQERYEEAVARVHGTDDPVYNVKEGGYYHEAWCSYALNKAAYLSVQWLDLTNFKEIIKDVMNTIRLITTIKENKLPFVRKYDSYSCSSCVYLEYCKPHLGVWNNNEKGGETDG